MLAAKRSMVAVGISRSLQPMKMVVGAGRRELAKCCAPATAPGFGHRLGTSPTPRGMLSRTGLKSTSEFAFAGDHGLVVLRVVDPVRQARSRQVPPADPPPATTRFGSIPRSLACDRTHRMADFASWMQMSGGCVASSRLTADRPAGCTRGRG